MNLDIRLRDVTREDLRLFYRHQRDPESVRMAAVAVREREAFEAHWTQVLEDESIAKRTILVDG